MLVMIRVLIVANSRATMKSKIKVKTCLIKSLRLGKQWDISKEKNRPK